AAETRPLRRSVLRPHQTEAELVYPGDDAPATLHLGAFLGASLVGVASLYREPPAGESGAGDWRLRGMAVAPELRGTGAGARRPPARAPAPPPPRRGPPPRVGQRAPPRRGVLSPPRPRDPGRRVRHPRHRPALLHVAGAVSVRWADPMAPKVIPLRRGGAIVETSIGAVQFGAPPETLKDALNAGLEVPSIFVLPRVWFSRRRGASLAPLAVPAYHNYFVCRRPVPVVCDAGA